MATTREVKRILVALKPWQRGLPLAAYHARCLAERLGATLTLVSCVFDPAVAFALSLGDRRAAAAQAGILKAEEEHLESLACSLRDWGVQVESRAVWDQPPYEGILRQVETDEADLLAIGAHEPGTIPRPRLTATDWQLMRLSPCPLLLVKDPEFETYPSILAAVDPLHMHAEPAGLDRRVLHWARVLARAFGAKLHAVHAYPEPERFALVSAVEVLPGVYYGAENIETVHRRAVDELVAEFGILPENVVLEAGEPQKVITEAAARLDAKLIVMGSVKRGRLEQALLGSTAEAVAADAECDVLMVK